MKVLFYTAACMLDISLEFINMMKKKKELHVLIEITPLTKKTNILNIEHLPSKPALLPPSELLSEEELENFRPYFDGVASVQFVVHTSLTGLSLGSLYTSRLASKFIKRLNPDVIHYELGSMSLRSIGLVKCFRACKKLHLTIHDPEDHPGETNVKTYLANKIFSNLNITKLHFYSRYSKEKYYSKTQENKPFEILDMTPYTFYKNYKTDENKKHQHILFFGRLSKYKGIELFLKAIKIVLKHYPNTQFIIAGKTSNGYVFDETVINNHPKNIKFINRHITNRELADLINNAKFTVCPYIEASQSGVLMTSLALGTPVIATKVGAFPEFIKENINGWLVPQNDANALADKIMDLLKTKNYINTAFNLKELETSSKKVYDY